MIYLISDDHNMRDEWRQAFSGYKDIEIVSESLFEFLYKNEDIDGIVVPSNSFGKLITPFGKELVECLGEEAQTNILTMIDAIYNGYQSIGSAEAIPFDRYTLIHTPVTRFNESISDYSIIFDCMMSCLRIAKKHNLDNIVIPIIGDRNVYNYQMIARFMELALKISTIGHIDMSNRGMNMIRCKMDKIRCNRNWLV